MIKKHIFIPGMNRSGTSWICHWLKQCPDVFVLGETYMVTRMSALMKWVNTYRRRTIISNTHLKSFFDNVYKTHLREKSIIVDKSPGSLFWDEKPCYHIIYDFYPNARVLIMIKDGKDYVYSVTHAPWKGPSLEDAIKKWIDSIRCLLEYPDNRILVVQYENLIDNPSYSKSIAQYFGIKNLPDIQPWIYPVNTLNKQLVRGKWRTFSTDDIGKMKDMNTYLEKLGYDPI